MQGFTHNPKSLAVKVTLSDEICRSTCQKQNKPDLHGLLSNRLIKMSLKTLPLLFINLGGEMVYILDQRLRAQNIPDEKAKKGVVFRQYFSV